MPFIKVAEENSAPINLYYEDHGSGDPVVLIHGWPLSSASWEKQVPVLLAAGHRVITYDRRGFGKSSQPSFGFDADTLAGDLEILINHLDLYNVTLVGFSMGGVEVARYLGKYGAKRIRQAALISAVTPYLLKTSENPKGVDGEVFEKMKKGIRADRFSFLGEFFRGFYNVGIFKGHQISSEALHRSWGIAAEASPIATHDIIDSWLEDFRYDLKNAGVPFLIIHGVEDQTVPYEASGKRVLEAVTQGKLVAIEGAPHGLNWTHAELLNEALIEFLGENRPSISIPETLTGLKVDGPRPTPSDQISV